MSEGSWFYDQNFNGLSDDFFDNVGTGFDVPLEDVEKEGDDEEQDWNTQFQLLNEPCFDVFSVPKPGGTWTNNNKQDTSPPPKRKALTTPLQYNNISKRKQLQEATITHCGTSIVQRSDHLRDVKEVQMLQIHSPVSVFETSSSCSSENPTFDPFIPLKRSRRSMRLPRSNCAGLFSVLCREKKRRRGEEMPNLSAVTRKCTHCEITKTPQWREGPMGPKTLCNACGVRYRSGRLFPEYRPAASPTFMPSLHSNCHKKVVEMRSKADGKILVS